MIPGIQITGSILFVEPPAALGQYAVPMEDFIAPERVIRLLRFINSREPISQSLYEGIVSTVCLYKGWVIDAGAPSDYTLPR
ncbi:MAG: hypothetical protein WCL71_15215, partial [Deltaproteobacteria bacterium]